MSVYKKKYSQTIGLLRQQVDLSSCRFYILISNVSKAFDLLICQPFNIFDILNAYNSQIESYNNCTKKQTENQIVEKMSFIL